MHYITKYKCSTYLGDYRSNQLESKFNVGLLAEGKLPKSKSGQEQIEEQTSGLTFHHDETNQTDYTVHSVAQLEKK